MPKPPSGLKRAGKAFGSLLAVPLRLADFLLGVPQSTEGSQTVRELQRLAEMRNQGELSDEEYRLAKERMLGGS
jgi:hypothetical protein